MEQARPPLSPRTALLLLTVLATTANAANVNEDACTMRDGSAGVCRSITDCDAAREDLKRGGRPVICSFDGVTPIVCCPLPNAVDASAEATATAAPTVGRKAGLKCSKYAEAVFIRENTFFGVTVVKDTCFKRGLPPLYERAAFPNEFPHVALLGYERRQQPEWPCDGALISERYILTAAHCLQSAEGPPVVVRLGEQNLTDDHGSRNQHEDYGVEKIIWHPDFSPRAYYNDVGLIKLDRDVKFTRSIRPACLNVLPEIPDKTAIVAEWELGYQTIISDILVRTTLPLQTAEVCRKAFSKPTPRLKQGFDGASMICAGDLTGGKDACHSDSGAPLQTELAEPYCMYNIIGVANFRKLCGPPNSPSVYARVSYYLPWIESIVWPDDK